MGIFSERIAELDIQLSSPDGNVHARLSSGDHLEVWFAQESYERYTEIALEHQLVSLGRLLLATRTRARREALSEALGGRSDHHSGLLDDPRQRRFREEQAKLVAVGRSAWIEITATPGEFWSVRIETGALSQLTEAQFLSDLHAAIAQTVIELRGQLFTLRQDIYGQQLPDPTGGEGRSWR